METCLGFINQARIFSSLLPVQAIIGQINRHVNTILSRHSGAIKTFHLNISSIPSSQHSVIDEWMLLLSTNGVKDLTLQNLDSDDALYTLPSFMYGVELEKLYLSSCIFRPPCSFRGFHKLKSLCLIHLTLQLEDVATHSFLRMPNLVRLQVRACIGTLHHWKIYAPELLRLFYYTSRPGTLKLDHLLGCRKLNNVILASYKHQEKPTNLTCFLNCWPEVRCLYLDSYYLKSFAYSGSTEADRLPTCLNNLRLLAPFYFDFDDEERIFSVLRMLRSCPNLEELLFTSNLEKKGGKEVDVYHFEGPPYRIQGLNKLKKLTVQNYRGTKNEFLFVRFILASAPLLLKTIIRVDPESVDKSQYLMISNELMGSLGHLLNWK